MGQNSLVYYLKKYSGLYLKLNSHLLSSITAMMSYFFFRLLYFIYSSRVVIPI